jgi:ribonuclease HI
MTNPKLVLPIHTDGASSGNPGPGFAMWIILEPTEKNKLSSINANSKVIREERIKLNYCTNNEAEYKAVIYALNDLLENPSLHQDCSQIQFFIDSNLVVQQLNGKFKVKNANIREYVFKINSQLTEIQKEVIFNYIPREKNLADKLKYN